MHYRRVKKVCVYHIVPLSSKYPTKPQAIMSNAADKVVFVPHALNKDKLMCCLGRHFSIYCKPK